MPDGGDPFPNRHAVYINDNPGRPDSGCYQATYTACGVAAVTVRRQQALGPAHLRRPARPAPHEHRSKRRYLPPQARARAAVRTRAQPSADLARLDLDHRLHTADADRDDAFPHLRELLDHQGAFVEAVLLFADPEGRPRDLFAWCLAIPDTETGHILARTVLPASLSRTAYADVINNLIAVVGWAEWHPPHHVTGPAASATRVGTSRAEHDPRDHVYVLRAGRGATWIRTTAGDPTSRTGRVRPHRRRGHWRRQHHGPGNQLLKWVRIAPTIVNAHAGPLSPQIYRLPPPPGARS